jgi:hypothetical protein
MSNLGVIERKVFGALVILSNSQHVAKVSTSTIAKTMGYKKSGGAITFALKSLEMNNHIEKLSDGSYKVFL